MNLLLQSKSKIFSEFKSKFEKALIEEINFMGKKNPLRDACEYALLNEGKRFRPLIVMLIAKCLNKNYEVINVALACEFFHTASLIADDLPCMDDEKIRRCKPALHLVFGESTAILASYALISAGYELIYKNTKALESRLSKEECNNLCVLALEIVSRHAGIHGATGGQFLDLFTENSSLDTIIEVIYKKTISLFEISFSLGWLFSGGDLSKLNLVRKCSYHFGMAFQIADDIKDFEEDSNMKKQINVAIALGKEKALDQFIKEIALTKDIMKELNIFCSEFINLIAFMENHLKGC
jgi:geranylgeranyl diphosphate synthase, type II